MSRSVASEGGTSEILRMTLSLGTIAFFVSVMLAIVNAFTAPVIERNEMRILNDFLSSLFVDADTFEQLTIQKTDEVEEGYGALREGQLLGTVFIVSSRGYGGPIRLAVGVDRAGYATGISVLSESETPGIGTRVTHEDYYAQYYGLSDISSVDLLTGATTSSVALRRAVMAAQSAAIRFFNS